MKMKLYKINQQLILLAAACAGASAWGADYLGVLKPPRSGLEPTTGFYSLFSSSLSPAALPEDTRRLKLGYKYSPYLAIEGEYVDFGSRAGTLFANPAHLSSAFKSTGFGVDTVATLPVWSRFSFYGRFGAYRGEPRNVFGTLSTSLLGESQRGTRLRYGLGLRYDFTKALGVTAEVERYAPLGTSFSSDVEADLFSVGLKWRF